ncbi:glutamate synthase subunit beta [candidate division WOR-3 bacterium]|nr:glutamate synthase subunit beta [candidate division WOR-3 bacterium]
MGKINGFLEIKREVSKQRPIEERIKDYKDVTIRRKDDKSREQAARCMDCGTPFCHWGCPIGNYIPEWNDFMFNNQWEKAYELLSATNNFPEITGRICPAPCEHSCVLSINDDAITIRENELAIIEHAFKSVLIKANPPVKRTGKKIAVVGSGPAGLAAADQLNKAGHSVTVFERNKKTGGILRYGIPDFKLEKEILDRRLDLMEKEGIKFKVNKFIGMDIPAKELLKNFDAVCLACGSGVPRDLKIPGRELKGIHFAMDFLIQANKRVWGEKIPEEEIIDAKNKAVIIIGGGDTGADCVGVAKRQGAKRITQIEILEKPPECRTSNEPWPYYPSILKNSSSHEEGCERHWSLLTKRFIGKNGKIEKLQCVEVEFSQNTEKSCPVMKEISGSEFEINADLVILAVGFLHPEHKGLVRDLNLELTNGNVKTDENFMTSKKGIFSAGDMHRGQSLIVWAISEGRKAAHQIDKYLMGKSNLPVL